MRVPGGSPCRWLGAAISSSQLGSAQVLPAGKRAAGPRSHACATTGRCQGENFVRSEEHTSELQSHLNLVCRLLLEKKKKKHDKNTNRHSTVAARHKTVLTATHSRH